MGRLILHMGMAKAGSSAIQKALLDQEEALKALNILNPGTGRIRGAHWGLYREIRDGKEPAFFRELAIESRDYPITVISCEAFYLLDGKGIARLKEATAAWDVSVILYLRHPGGFLGSSYRMHIKSGKLAASPIEFIAMTESRLEYDHMVARWSEAFPLTVRIYDRHRSNIEQDFLNQLGAGHLTPQRRIVNGTPSDGVTRIMRTANRFVSKRSRRRRISRTLLGLEKYFRWIPPIDNTAFQQAGQNAVSRWDRDVMLRYISEEEYALLTT